ncbi:MAG: hypothetical protein ACOC2X_01400 [Bacillota bacterium]
MNRLMHHLDRLIFLAGFIVALSALLSVFSYDQEAFAGYEVVFGVEIFDLDPFGIGSFASAHLPFSLVGLVAFAFPLVGGVLVLVGKRYVFIAAGLFIVSVVMFILLRDATEIVYTIGGGEQTETVDWTLEIGYYLGITASLAGALLSVLGLMKNVK